MANVTISRPVKLYSCAVIEELIRKCVEFGYEYIQISEGTLGCGDWVLISPDNSHWNYVGREIYLNCWSSGNTLRRCREISKSLQKEIDEALERDYMNWEE